MVPLRPGKWEERRKIIESESVAAALVALAANTWPLGRATMRRPQWQPIGRWSAPGHPRVLLLVASRRWAEVRIGQGGPWRGLNWVSAWGAVSKGLWKRRRPWRAQKFLRRQMRLRTPKASKERSSRSPWVWTAVEGATWMSQRQLLDLYQLAFPDLRPWRIRPRAMRWTNAGSNSCVTLKPLTGSSKSWSPWERAAVCWFGLTLLISQMWSIAWNKQPRGVACLWSSQIVRKPLERRRRSSRCWRNWGNTKNDWPSIDLYFWRPEILIFAPVFGAVHLLF